MTGEDGPASGLSPDDAFAVLADETRLGILRALGEADGPLSFSELFERADYDTSGNFNYHLDRLEGHFLRRTDEGYVLRQAGRRVVEAVLSGVVTEAPVVEPSEIDEPCPFCGSGIAVSFRRDHVDMFCPDCPGTYGQPDLAAERDVPAGHGYLGAVHLPPAGVRDRSPVEMTRTALTWGNLEFFAVSSGVCPRCSAQLDESVAVCEAHDGGGVCAECGNRHAVQIRHRCPVCIFDERGGFWNALWADPDFLSFLIDHGIDPVSPSPGRYSTIVASFREEVLSVDPFEARFTYTIDDESIALTVGEDLDVVDATRCDVTGSPG